MHPVGLQQLEQLDLKLFAQTARSSPSSAELWHLLQLSTARSPLAVSNPHAPTLTHACLSSLPAAGAALKP